MFMVPWHCWGFYTMDYYYFLVKQYSKTEKQCKIMLENIAKNSLFNIQQTINVINFILIYEFRGIFRSFLEILLYFDFVLYKGLKF